MTHMSLQTINQRTLQRLIDDRLIWSGKAVRNDSHWELVVSCGRASKLLAKTPSNEVRTWSKIDTLVRYVAKLGIKHLEIDLTGYTAGVNSGVGVKRPKLAKTMRQSHEAATHDLWFREQVSTALNVADSSHAMWIKPDDVRSRMQVRAKNTIGYSK